MQKKNASKIAIGLILIAIVGLAAGYFFMQEKKAPLSELAREQMEALKIGNLTRAYYLFTSDQYQENTGIDQFREWVKSNPIISENDQLEIYGEKIQGDYATVSGGLKSENAPDMPVVYHLVNEYGGWKIDQIQLLEGGQLASTDQKPFSQNESIAQIVQSHLLALKMHDYRKAYDQHLAPEFKKTVPYDEYQTILRENPELTEYDLIKFGPVNEENGLQRIHVTLISDEENQHVRFWLAKVKGDWMIWAMEVNGPTAQQVYELGDDVAMENDKPVTGDEKKDQAIALIKQQLDLIREGNVKEAYENFTSDEFKEATSAEDFNQFINNYPEFKEYKSVRFGNKTETNGILLQQVVLASDKGNSDIDFWLAKQNGDYKVWGIRVEESAFYPPISEEEKEALVKVIQGQLASLRNGDLSKSYYAFVSQDFENNTSFDDFKAFLDEYPIFTKQEGMTVGNGVQEGDLRLVRVALQSEEETAEVDYRLIKQDDQWKIWGIQILTNVQDTPENEEEVKQVIQDQLAALKEGDFSRAYYAFSSKQFQEAASFDVFEKYVKRHSELGENEKASIQEIDFKPSYTTVAVVLTSKGGSEESYQYRLIFENDKWKILSIKILREDEEQTQAAGSLTISKIQMGTEIDLSGLVTNPATTFSTEDEELTVNVFIKEGQIGDQIEAVLEHVKSKSSIPPVTAKLDRAGESVVNYVFTAPTQGWPVGAYQLHVTSSTGAKDTFEFDVTK